jgi:2-hydroxychromene-2-carboxylate isomerase
VSSFVKYGEAPRTCREGLDRVSLPDVPSIIYYDFTSAESFVVNEIVQGLTTPDDLAWRGVQVAPTLPVPAMVLERRARERLEIEVHDAGRVSPEITAQLPTRLPNTRAALQAVASVERMHRTRADAFRTALFRAYWQRDVDISDLTAIVAIAAEAGVPPWVDLEHQAAQAAQVSWELAWQAERLGGVPRVIRTDGQILWAVKDATSVRAFLSGRS